MKVLVLDRRATEAEIQQMLEAHGSYVKLAVDVRRGILAGGGAYHADCEEALIEVGSQQEDVWGADWHPDTLIIDFMSLINIRPRQGNRGMEIRDPSLREAIERTVRSLLEEEP